eukprot:3371011-Pleurochrysis_carterae.AAC.1
MHTFKEASYGNPDAFRKAYFLLLLHLTPDFVSSAAVLHSTRKPVRRMGLANASRSKKLPSKVTTHTSPE